MATSQHIEFGYNPPSGDRGRETIRPREYQSDLKAALDVATQGFKSIWVADHLNYSTEWRLECWTLLTWIAARYPDVGLSTLVMSNTFRHPSVMAKMGAALQELSGGRFALGYGAGWHEGEHDAFGLQLYRPGERIDRMEEAVLVIKALWSDAPANFSGRYYSLNNAYAEPRPDPVPPIMIGGAGEKKTLRVVAKYADWWNDVARPVPELQHKLNVLRKVIAMRPAATSTQSANRSRLGRSSTASIKGRWTSWLQAAGRTRRSSPAIRQPCASSTPNFGNWGSTWS